MLCRNYLADVFARAPLCACAVVALLVISAARAPAADKSDDSASAGILAKFDALVDDEDRRHWAFQPLREVAVPEVKDRDWVHNPIDAFVLSRLEQNGWRPAPAAEPLAWLRRVSLDLTGTGPTPDEQEAFVNDSSPERFSRVIDDLLSRPSYGERWGRHWLDLVRYAESNGYERDGAKPAVWRYRDYVIRSLNADKPFDRFILEQIAGDELPDADSETVIATSFYRLGPWDDEPAEPKADRFDQLDDMVRTTSEAFLGLTIGCARCHNHKLEPLTMHDYYRMVAVFNPLVRPQRGRTELTRPAGSREQVAALAERDRQIAELHSQKEELRRSFRRGYLESGQSKLPAEAVAAFLVKPDDRNDEQKELVKAHADALRNEIDVTLPDEIKTQMAGHDESIARLRAETSDLPPAYVMFEPDPEPPATHLLLRGKATSPSAEVAPGVPTVLASVQPAFESPDEHSSRRRITLARWIASPENPLTARVIVNRLWHYHFGEGLVRTPSDFGTMGDEPTHPELLDWLTRRFIQDGWSLKKLHRLILESNTYRMAKVHHDEYADHDPENRLLWRFPYRRLEVEAIRDSMLAASGRLNRQMYDQSVYPFVPREALVGNSDPDTIWQPFDERTASRRTIYAFLKRSMIVPMLEVLDLCDTTRSSAKRAVSSVAPQALTLFNGNFVNRQARHLADRLVAEVGTDADAQIEHAFCLALCRPVSQKERDDLRRFLDEESIRLEAEATDSDTPLDASAARHEALVQVCRVIFNLNEFVYPD